MVIHKLIFFLQVRAHTLAVMNTSTATQQQNIEPRAAHASSKTTNPKIVADTSLTLGCCAPDVVVGFVSVDCCR